MLADMNADNPTIASLERAMDPIIAEMFQNGFEEGSRIWEDETHPLAQAIQILMRAKCSVFAETPEGLALWEMLKAGEFPADVFGKIRERAIRGLS